MKNTSLLKRVSALGVPFFEVDDGQNVNVTLADMAKSKDLRLWEGFPVALANSAERGLFDPDKAVGHLKKPFDRQYFTSLMLLSLALYKLFNLKFRWTDKLYKSLTAKQKKELSRFLNSLNRNADLGVAGRKMSVERVKNAFNSYYAQSQARLNELVVAQNDLSLEYALSHVFSPKQKELFLKKFKREKFTKTEKEYFSRVVKKKVQALANPELHRLSQKLMEM